MKPTLTRGQHLSFYHLLIGQKKTKKKNTHTQSKTVLNRFLAKLLSCQFKKGTFLCTIKIIINKSRKKDHVNIIIFLSALN